MLWGECFCSLAWFLKNTKITLLGTKRKGRSMCCLSVHEHLYQKCFISLLLFAADNGFSHYDDTQTQRGVIHMAFSQRTLQIFEFIFQIPSIGISQLEDYKTEWTRCVVVIIINRKTPKDSYKIRIDIVPKSYRIDWCIHLGKNEVQWYLVRIEH